jgi:hypothetical protein
MQLHVVEELLDLLQAEHDDPATIDDDSEEETLMSISKLAASGATTPRAVRVVGMIEDQEVLILVDSGSSHCFLSDTVAAKLSIQAAEIPVSRVRVAGGGILQCNKQIKDCVWWAQGYSFSTDLRILALGCYDMVLGMDWLESIGEMNIDWVQKSLHFQHQGEPVSLQGVCRVCS